MPEVSARATQATFHTLYRPSPSILPAVAIFGASGHVKTTASTTATTAAAMKSFADTDSFECLHHMPDSGFTLPRREKAVPSARSVYLREAPYGLREVQAREADERRDSAGSGSSRPATRSQSHRQSSPTSSGLGDLGGRHADRRPVGGGVPSQGACPLLGHVARSVPMPTCE